MKHLVEFPLEDEDCILVEVEVDDQNVWKSPIRGEPAGKEVPQKALITFQEAMEKVKPAAETIIKKLRNLSDPADEIEVQFGLKLTAEAGAVLAVAGIEANYTVTLKWKRSEKKN